MKKHILLSMVMLYTLTATAQNTEFTVHENGLIYDERTMARLADIVDSLNLRFKTCDVKNYHSLEQGLATVVLVKRNIRDARQAIKNAMPLDAFLQKFPGAKHRREWIVKFRYTNYRDEEVVEYASLPLRNRSGLSIRVTDRRAQDEKSGWILSEDHDGLIAMEVSGVKSLPLPAGYAQLIQYVDCMIDTTTQIYLTDDASREPQEPALDSKIAQYLKFASDFGGEPQQPDIDWDSPSAEAQYADYSREYQQWNNERLAWLDEKMVTSVYHKDLLIEAMDEAIENKTGNEMLERYVERYLSPADVLKMKRLRQPMGFCSMDRGPRLHAQSICRLAAETTQWNIFLRAHLDIMNDNFSRVSDGSYAWAGRGTYLKELEALDINVLDLLIGSSLRASDVSDKHYFGDIGRLGRALSETESKTELERRLLAMVEDENLDVFNRLLMAYLFDNYNHHLYDEARKKDNVTRFKSVAAKLPYGIDKSFKK